MLYSSFMSTSSGRSGYAMKRASGSNPARYASFYTSSIFFTLCTVCTCRIFSNAALPMVKRGRPPARKKQSTILEAGLYPAIANPMSLIGRHINVPGSYWPSQLEPRGRGVPDGNCRQGLCNRARKRALRAGYAHDCRLEDERMRRGRVANHPTASGIGCPR